MTTKTISFGDDARLTMRRGIDKLARAARVTLGPRGRSVVLGGLTNMSLGDFAIPTVTNDGNTLVRDIDLSDPVENLGAALVKEVAKKTNDIVGDGTTTATVLFDALVGHALRNVTAGADPIAIKRGLQIAGEAVTTALVKMAIDVSGKEIQRVATISAKDDDIGRLIGQAFGEVGSDGVITVEESNTTTTELTISTGMRFDRGYISPYFITDPTRAEATLGDCLVLVASEQISAVDDVLPTLEGAGQEGKPLFILCDDVEGEALATLIINTLRKTVQVVAVKAPSYGDRRKAFLHDFAIATGAQVISSDAGLTLSDATLQTLGSARKIIVTKESTTLIDGGGDNSSIADRVAQLRAEMGRTPAGDYELDKLRERIARLSSGIAMINVGALTDIEMRAKKQRVEDAVAATRAAITDGIVPGGGAALIHAGQVLNDHCGWAGDEAVGISVVRKALIEPLRWISHNAGMDSDVVIATMRRLASEGNSHIGFNVASEQYQDLVQAGVIDPVKVTVFALRHAISAAAMLITTEACLVDTRRAETTANSGVDGAGHGHSHRQGPGF